MVHVMSVDFTCDSMLDLYTLQRLNIFMCNGCQMIITDQPLEYHCLVIEMEQLLLTGCNICYNIGILGCCVRLFWLVNSGAER